MGGLWSCNLAPSAPKAAFATVPNALVPLRYLSRDPKAGDQRKNSPTANSIKAQIPPPQSPPQPPFHRRLSALIRSAPPQLARRSPMPILLPIPQITIVAVLTAKPNVDKNIATNAPPAAPTNRAGEKTPPKTPVPMQKALAAIFASISKAKNCTEWFCHVISKIVAVPRPRPAVQIRQSARSPLPPTQSNAPPSSRFFATNVQFAAAPP